MTQGKVYEPSKLKKLARKKGRHVYYFKGCSRLKILVLQLQRKHAEAPEILVHDNCLFLNRGFLQEQRKKEIV